MIDVAAGDLGAPAYRKFDLEAWLPGRGEGGDWGEVTSCSNCTDYQARRLRIRFKREGGKRNELVHTLNGTADRDLARADRAAREPPAGRREHRDPEGPAALHRASIALDRASRASAAKRCASEASAKPRLRRSHRPRQDLARARAHRRRHRSPARGEGARHHHRARLCAARSRRAACASRWSTCPGTKGSCARWWPARPASISCCSWWRPTRA